MSLERFSFGVEEEVFCIIIETFGEKQNYNTLTVGNDYSCKLAVRTKHALL